MDPIQKRELKRKAWMRLAAQRRRAGLLRGRVVAVSLICFVVLWGVVFAQMATGNDPVLSPKEKAAASRTAANPSRQPETTHRRELEAERAAAKKAAREAAAAEVEFEAEGEFEENEAGAEEAELAQIEAAEIEAAEIAEIEAAEIAEIEAAEAETLVTSQS